MPRLCRVMSISPIPDVKTVSGFRKYMVEYIIMALAAALITLFYMFINLNTYIRTDLLQQQIRATGVMEKSNETTRDFLNFQRFQRPIRADIYDSIP